MTATLNAGTLIQAWATCSIESCSVALKSQCKSTIENIGEKKVSFRDFKSHASVLHTVYSYKTIWSDPHQASRNHWKCEISRKQDLDSFLFFPIFACNYVPFVKSNNSNRSSIFEWYRAFKKTIKERKKETKKYKEKPPKTAFLFLSITVIYLFFTYIFLSHYFVSKSISYCPIKGYDKIILDNNCWFGNFSICTLLIVILVLFYLRAACKIFSTISVTYVILQKYRSLTICSFFHRWKKYR